MAALAPSPHARFVRVKDEQTSPKQCGKKDLTMRTAWDEEYLSEDDRDEAAVESMLSSDVFTDEMMDLIGKNLST
jgi:hypothetical protein